MGSDIDVDVKFSMDDLEIACDDLGTIPHFPRDLRASVILELSRMCPHKRALEWVVREARSHLTVWPGLAEVRGILCTRFDAADGIDQLCSLPGYTSGEMEARYLLQHEQLKATSRRSVGAHE